MMNKLLFGFFLLCSCQLFAQPMEVLRTKTVKRNSPVRHVFIDEDNVKWVLNEVNVHEVLSADFGQVSSTNGWEMVLGGYAGGKRVSSWPIGAIAKVLSDISPDDVSAGFYESEADIMWIGTYDQGIYKVKISPTPRLAGKMTARNSKLRTDGINFIKIDNFKRKWIGSTGGLLMGTGNKWKLINKDYDVKGLATFGKRSVFVGDEWLWTSDESNSWDAMELRPQLTEGDLVDIAFDSQGRLWIASEIISRYDEESDRFDLFGGPENFTSQFVSCIAIDQEDALWVGTEDKGLFLIDKKSAISVVCKVDKSLSCGGDQQDAALKVIVSGGLSPYTYKWSGAQQGPNPTNLGPGEYAVTVTDSKGKSNTARAEIKEKNMTLVVSSEKAESGEGNADGVALATAEGGATPYTYAWDNGETTARAQKLAQGEHAVTVTDQDGCEMKALVMIERKVGELSVQLEQTAELKCADSKEAVLTAKVSGGKAPFTYQWNNQSTEQQLNGLAAGSYQLVVTDASGQKAQGTFEIKAPEPVTATAEVDASATTDQKDGQASAKANGGTGKYTYRWDNGETKAKAKALGPGEHQVSVTDEAGCTAVASVTITEDILPLQVSIDQIANNNCFGDKKASLSANVKGGKKPFQYQWKDLASTNEQAAGLGAGSYQLVVIDASGLSATASAEVKDPAQVTATAEVDASATTDQKDGQASAKANGGTGKYTYRWDNGETKAKAKALAPGEHQVSVTDEAGCTAVASVTITEDILPLQVSIEQIADNKCFGDKKATLSANVKGGKKPFQYQWKDLPSTAEQAAGLGAGNYQLVVTDASGLSATASAAVKDPVQLTATAEVDASATTDQKDGQASAKANGGTGKYTYRWDNGEAKAKAKALAPGEHQVSITDESGCTAVASVTITEDILPLQVSIEQSTPNNCNGAKEAVLVTKVRGGKRPFQYQWSEGNQQGEKASGLAAGNYIVTVTDASGLSATANAAVKDPAALTATVEVDASATTDQSDGRASVSVKGGTGKYTYRWDNGETRSKANKLNPGKHNVTVTDESNCITVAEVTITEDILPLQLAIEQTATINCQGEGGAALQAQVRGGKRPFKYLWSEGGKTEDQLSGLKAGAYQLTVEDASGLQETASFKVPEPEALSVNIRVNASATTNNKDGRATAEVRGGSGTYTYRWDNGETSANAERLGPGQREVVVTDDAGCKTTATTEITEDILPLAVTIKRLKTNKCYGEDVASLQVEIGGGKAPFKYEWSDASLSGDQVSGLKGGNYKITVFDASGQQTVGNVDIAAPKELKVEITKQRPATNDRINDGQLFLNVSGGTGAYNISWDNDREGESNKRLAAGSHQVTITDGNECQQVLPFEIETRIIPQLTANQLRRGQTVKLEKLNFDADSTNLNTTALPILDELFLFLEDNPNVVIEVGGHTNNIPEHDFCDRLSTARAKSVADYIVQQGIDANRVYYKGYGKRKPIESNRTKEGRRKNQRVEIKILKVNPG